MLSSPPIEEKLDPRIKRTRKLIQQAFNELLAEKGFGNITVQDVTERAEVNRATFYAHYPDKFALLEETIRQAFRAELEKRTLSACHYSEDNLRALIVTVCEFIANSNERCKESEHQFDSLVEMQVRKQIYELIELWLTKNGSGGDRQTTATVASWSIYGLAMQWNQDKGKQRLSAEEFAERVLPLITVNFGVG